MQRTSGRRHTPDRYPGGELAQVMTQRCGRCACARVRVWHHDVQQGGLGMGLGWAWGGPTEGCWGHRGSARSRYRPRWRRKVMRRGHRLLLVWGGWSEAGASAVCGVCAVHVWGCGRVCLYESAIERGVVCDALVCPTKLSRCNNLLLKRSTPRNLSGKDLGWCCCWSCGAGRGCKLYYFTSGQ